MKAAIVSVGTELTVGQIINKNATWISKKLKEFGVPSNCHLSVPDDRTLILDALRFAQNHGDLIFVTGGLGPTTDDFTRDLIAEWSGQALEFHQASWDHVNQRLASRKIEVRESQKQQCLFPKGAQVLTNAEGTANGFHMQAFGKEVFVLPGPPREVEAVWNAGIHAFLKSKTQNIDRHLTFSWDTLGYGESDIAHITENVLQGVNIEKGYRVHLPYVEVKLSFFESEKNQMMSWVEKVDEALAPMTVTRNEEDVAILLARKLQDIPHLVVVDTVSGQILLNRIAPAFRGFMNEKHWSITTTDVPTSKNVMKMVLKELNQNTAQAEIHYLGATFKTHFEAPFMISQMKERMALYFTERALIFWLQMMWHMH